MLRARCLYADWHKASKALYFLFTLSLFFILSACNTGGILSGVDAIPLPFNPENAWKTADSTMLAQTGWMYADTYTRPHYQQTTPHLLWATEYGIDEKADTLLSILKGVEAHGLSTTSFHVKEIEQHLNTLRAFVPDSCEECEVSRVQGCLDYLLTEAYMRYAYGQRYGYVRPHKLFNNLLLDTPEPGSKATEKYRRIFDIQCDIPEESFFQEAISHLKDDIDGFREFLQEIQPSDELYLKIQQAHQEAKVQGDKEKQRLCAINLERGRWRYQRPTEEKYVWVNLANFMLTAVNTKTDSILTMRVCGGDSKHKTPLLRSEINRLELNPYWVIPTSIIRNELIPHHINDSSYYARNNIRAINNKTKEESDPWLLSAAQLKSGLYTLRQEKGAGNSLGRMIFRFPNDFAVYLHDTNNPSAFNKNVRAVSHGCVRVQHPLDLATFLMDDPDEDLVDRIRIAIGRKPLGEKGKKLMEENPEYEGMKSHTFKPAIPVYLDYYTLYPSPKDGKLNTYPDNYGYDKEIEKILKQF